MLVSLHGYVQVSKIRIAEDEMNLVDEYEVHLLCDCLNCESLFTVDVSDDLDITEAETMILARREGWSFIYAPNGTRHYCSWACRSGYCGTSEHHRITTVPRMK